MELRLNKEGDGNSTVGKRH